MKNCAGNPDILCNMIMNISQHFQVLGACACIHVECAFYTCNNDGPVVVCV